MGKKAQFPGTFYGPEGKSQVFEHRAEVPDGWEDHPAKVADYKGPFEIDSDTGETTLREGEVVHDVSRDTQEQVTALDQMLSDEEVEVEEGASMEDKINALMQARAEKLSGSSNGGGEDEGIPEDYELPGYDDISKPEIQRLLDIADIPYEANANKQPIYDLLAAHLKKRED